MNIRDKVTEHLISRNFTGGRRNKTIKRIIIHTYGGGGSSLYNWFNREGNPRSAHYSVLLSGNIEQYVKDGDTAWHASNWAINLESIGIEHQDNNIPGDSVRTPEQYESSANLVASLCQTYNVPCNATYIEPHNRYAPRKSCPGGLDINKIISMAQQILSPGPHYDELYRVFKDDLLLGTFAVKDNAFDRYCVGDANRVTFKDQDLTLEFNNSKMQYQAQITALQDEVAAKDATMNALNNQLISYRDGSAYSLKDLCLILLKRLYAKLQIHKVLIDALQRIRNK